jgi:hypothetical protein
MYLLIDIVDDLANNSLCWHSVTFERTEQRVQSLLWHSDQ